MTKTLSTIGRPAFQGDVMFVLVNAIPENVKPATPDGKHYIIAHSETGHHHVLDRAKAEVYEAADNTFIAYIKTMGDGVDVIHQREFDTHETVALPPNSVIQVRRQREYVPEGFRAAQD